MSQSKRRIIERMRTYNNARAMQILWNNYKNVV